MQDRVLIEEDDLFKFNCGDIKPNDFVSLQLVGSLGESAGAGAVDEFE